MSALDSVLGFFRQNEDDLEATDQPESPSELQSDGSLRFGGMGAPFGFLTSEYDPVASANSLAGPVYSDSMTGKSYVAEPDTDQRTDREILTDTAKAVSGAVIKKANEPWEQPQLPSAKQTYEFAKKAATETVDLFDRLASGDGSLLEILEAATGVGLGAKVAQKAFPDPELDGSAFTTGMFLNENSKNADTAALDKAKAAESNGVDREAIYKDTGWFRFADEWLYEISDKDTNIKLLQEFKKPLATLEEVEVPIGLSKDGLELIRLSALADINDLNLEFINGNITQDEFQAAAKQVNAKYAAEANAPVGTETVLKEVNSEAPAKDRGILSEVLVNTDDLAAALPPGTMDQTAQIKGKRTGYYGVKYGGTPPKGLSKVNTFPGAIREKGEKSGPEALVKDLGFFKIGNADKELLEQLNAGKISKDQFYADLTWGIMLHETQHLVQEALSFKSGRGGTKDAAKEASKEPANKAVRDAMKELAMQDGWKKTKALLKQYKQKGDQRNTGSAFVSILNLRRKLDALGQDPNLDKDQLLEEAKKARTSYIEKIQASFPSLSDVDADALATELVNDSDVLDSTEVFDRIMVSKAGRLSDSTVTPAVDRDRYRLFPKSESKNPTKENIRYAAYSHIAGEALARLVTARRNLSTEQLRDNFPLNDLDVEEGMMFRVGTDAYPEDYSIDTTPPPRLVETPEPPAIKPSLDAEPDPQTIISVMDKNYFATENLNDADLRLKDPVGYVAGDILRFIEYFPNGATLKAIQGELIDGSPDPNSKDFLNKTQKKANEAFYTDERLQEALVYIDNNGLAAILHNGNLLANSTQILPTWQRKKPDGTVLTREDLNYPPWPPVDPETPPTPVPPTVKPNSDFSLEGLDNQIVAANFILTDFIGESTLGISTEQMARSYPVAFRAAEIMDHIREYDNLGVNDRVDLNQTLSDIGFGYWKDDNILDELNIDPVELDDNAIEALVQNGYIFENQISGYTINKMIEAPDAGSVDDQMEAGAMGSGVKAPTQGFKGKLNLVHGFIPENYDMFEGQQGEVAPPNFVPNESFTGERYDAYGGAYGSEGVYLENPSEPLFFNTNNMDASFFAPATAQVSANFENAFILEPGTVSRMAEITGLDPTDSLAGPDIAKILKAKGYDGLIVRGFEQKNYYDPNNETTDGLHDDLTQPQIIHFKPETLKTTKVFSQSLQKDPSQADQIPRNPEITPFSDSVDDQMEAGAMGSGSSGGGDRIYPQGSVFTSKTFDAMNFSDEQVAEMARVHKGIKSDFTDANRNAEQKRIDEKRDRLIEQYITAFTNTLASKGDKVVNLKSLKYAMKKDNALGGIEAAARQAADTNVILERMAGDIMAEEAMAERFVSMLDGPLFVGPKMTERYSSYLTSADIDKADPYNRETVRRQVEGDFSLNADQEEFFDRVYDEGYNNELLEWAATEHAIRSTLKKMQIPTTGDN
jgi:hypothetical protein